MIINSLLAFCALLLAAVEITYIIKSDGKKVLYSAISVASIVCCVIISIFKELNGVYAFLTLFITSVLNLIVISDIKTQYISNILLIVLNAIGLIAAFFAPNGNFMFNIILAWLITGIFFLVGRKSKGAIGEGDLFCMSGLLMSTGFSGMMQFVFMSLFSGTVYGIISLALKKKTLKSEMPFAPFLLVGYLYMLMCI